MKHPRSISKKELLDAIKRSGYLFESEISYKLSREGFFVESNQIVEDPITGKNREIDLLAEYNKYDKKSSDHKLLSKIKFIFEIKNNIYPLVLMTKFEFSPNVVIWESFKEAITKPDDIEWDGTEGFYWTLSPDDESLFTQYCSFDRKKGNKELMASHPEMLYSGLSKITQYCEEQVENWEESENDKYFRDFLYLPVLLIKNDLFELEINESSQPKLKKVEESKLVFNYYYKGDQKISIVYVVTEKGFSHFMKNMIKVEGNTQKRMLSIKTKKKA